MPPVDGVLLIAFGGPQGLKDVRPFLAQVVKGRNVPQDRIDEVAHHYEMFGGVSPITAFTRRQAEGLQRRLASAGVALPVYVGMRNWHPFLADTMTAMSREGVRRAIGFIMAPHASYSSCEQYRENVRDAQAHLVEAGLGAIEMSYVPAWHTHEKFIGANASHVRAAIEKLPADVRMHSRVIFTAHSIPLRMAEQSPYREQLLESSRLIANAAGVADWALAYQSRSGRPEDPWLEPDVCDYLREAKRDGLQAAVLCPVGFVCDHIEVLYDLDVEAANVAHDIQLPLTRAETVNDDPQFVDMMAEIVLAALRAT